MANRLMFEVGVSDSVQNLDKLKKELDQFIQHYSKDTAIKLKIDIENLQAVTSALSKIGDTPQLRNLRQEIESINKEFSKLAVGAGGVGDLGVRKMNQEVEDLKQKWDSAVRLMGRYNQELELARRNRDRETNLTDRQIYTDQINKLKENIKTQQEVINSAKSAYDNAVKNAGQLVDVNTRAEASFREVKRSIDEMKQSMSSMNVNVNIGQDFAKWTSEVQAVSASVRELVEQLQKMNNAAKESANVNNEALLAQAKTVDDLRTKYNKMLHDGMTIPKSAASYTAIENLPNVEKQLTAEQTRFNEMLIRGASVAGSFAEAIQQLGQKYSFTSEQAQRLAAIIASGNIERGEVQRRLGVGYNKAGDIVDTINALQKLKQEESKPAPQGGLFDPQKFNTLQEAIDKIIAEINRLQQAFTHLGQNGSLSNLSTMINGLAVTLSSLGNAIKIQPLDDQVKTLLERCEKAEAKLREVGDAARYLNEQAGKKTQQKAGTIMDITGTEAEQINKVSSTAERFMRLLVEIENQMARIGKIQALGEQSGFSPTLLKNAQNQLEALKKMVESTIKGTPIAEGLIMPASDSQLAQFIQQFGLLKAMYRDVVKEADRFNKANEKDSLKQKNQELREAASNMKAAENESRRLTETISNLEALANRAGALGVDTSRINDVINTLRHYKQVMDDIARNNTYDTKSTKLTEPYLQLKRNVKEVAQEIKKNMSAALKPDTEQANAFREYASLIRQISSLTKTAFAADKLNLDTTQLSQYIDKLKKYAQVLEAIARNGGSNFTSWKNSNVDYLNIRANAGSEQAAMNAKIAEEKSKNAVSTTQLSESEERLANSIKNSTDSMKGQSQILSDLKMMAMQYLSVWGAQSFVNSIIETGGLLEQQRLSLSAILGDMGKAQTLFGQIKTMALKSPFGVVELDKMSKQLAAYSFEYEELFEWTKRLADISAATGTSVDRLALALGHVRSEGALSGYTLRQFAMANVPVLRMLSENLGISSKEVRERVKKKEISAEDVQDILKQLTEDGGMFANAQETMSEALNAKFKNMRDAFDIMYNEIAESGVGDKLKDLAVILTDGAKHWERLAKDIKDVAIAFGIGKVAILAYNTALGKGTAVTLKSAMVAKQKEIANLKLTASYRDLTIAELRTMATTGKLNATNIATLLQTKKLTYAELERAVALGKVDKATAMAALRSQGMIRQMNLLRQVAPLTGFARAWGIITYNIRLAGAAIKSFMASVWPLLALTAAFEVWNRRSEQQDKAKDMAKTMAGNARGREAYEMRDSLADSSKLSKEALQQNITEMQNALTAADAYTHGLKKQVEATDDLVKKYDLLKRAIGEVAEKYEEQKSNQETLMNEAWDAGGGFLSDNMLEDTKQFDSAMAEFQKKLTIGSKQIKGVLNEWLQNQGQYKEAYANMTGKQIFESIGKNMQEAFLNYAWNAKGMDDVTSKMLRDISRAYTEVGDKFNEMHGKEGGQGELFAQTMKAMYEEAFKVDLDKATKEQKIAFDKWLRETLDRAEDLSKDAKEALRNIVIDFTIKLVPHYQVETPKTAQDVIDQQIGDNKWLSSFFSRQNNKSTTAVWTVETAEKEVKRYKKLFGDISLSNLDTAPKKLNSLLDGLEETKTNLQNTLEKGLLSKPEQEAIQKQIDEATTSIDLAEKALNDVGGKRERKGDKKNKGNGEDINAKAVREKVRIMKEAADAFKYWRDKVGDDAAWNHVETEFGDVLEKIKMTAKDAADLRNKLNAIKNSAEYNAIKDKKVKLEIDKEIAKEIAQLDRNDFEKHTEDWASDMARRLDELTRKWEIFNSVVSDTGDRALAARLTGITPGATPADLKRLNVAQFAGARIDFDSVLGMSDKQIEDYVYQIGVAEDKIKAVQNGLKDWKKAQEDLTKNDLQNYAKWLGSLVDLESIRMRNQEEYNRVLEETNRLLAQGKITQEEADRRRNAAATNLETKNWQATTLYSSLYNNSRAMAEGDFYAAYNMELASLNDQLRAGSINMSDYANKVGKLNKIMAEFEMRGFLGIKGGAGAYLRDGYQGLIDYHWNRAEEKRKNNDEAGAKKEEDTAKSMMKLKQTAEQLTKVFQDMANGADMLANMFDALGMEGAANAFGDAAGVLGGVASGASSLSSLGPWGMAAGAAIGGITSIAQLHDKKRQRQIEELKREVQKIDNTLNLIKDLRERQLGYDNGNMRRQLAQQYRSQQRSAQTIVGEVSLTPSAQAMYEYYSRGGLKGNGYTQELEALKKQREDYQKMYDAENDKKKSSAEALEEYKVKMAELDEQIMYYIEDLSKELWGIDFQSWADQISDALWTAFENGENALDAFHDTAKDIIADVAKKMMNIHLIEPLFNQLEEQLFGKYDAANKRYTGGAIKYDSNGNINMQESEPDVLRILGQFFGEGGSMEKNVEAAEQFYDWVQQITGIDFSSGDSKSTGTSIKSITEETADLLASYLNATRASVAKIESLQGQYFPMYYDALTRGNGSLTNIENHTAAIMRSNDAIQRAVDDLYRDFHGLRTSAWKMPVA